MAPAEPGRTRVCPHCKSTILESADVCPKCCHHLRFGAERSTTRTAQSLFRVEGTVSAPADAGPLEYDVVVALYDEGGAEVAREVVHVGALRPTEARRCVVSIEGFPAAGAVADKPRAAAPLAQRLVPRTPSGVRGRG